MYVNGWEFPQMNGGYDNWWTWNGDANIRILKTIRQVVGPDNYVMCHFTPERITGWPHYQHEDSDGEPDWWHRGRQQPRRHSLAGFARTRTKTWSSSDCIGGPSVDGTTDIGDCNRIVGSPSTWGLNKKVFIAFEYSRDCARGERLSRRFSVEKKVSGWGNMGYWNGVK